ncbi:MAG TPA: hypothetical protein VLJ68_01855 [Chitinophagaceae bacterium]|nr:hypothetical protein [Chitinophagaceae bacterium]
MKKIYVLTCFFLSAIFANSVYAQLKLSPEQQAAVQTYITASPVLSTYSADVRNKVLENQENIANIMNCWKQIKNYANWETIKKIESMDLMYSELGQKFPELRNNVMPGFSKLDYNAVVKSVKDYNLDMKAASHAELVKQYLKSRRDNLNKENAFGTMIILFPELLEKLRKLAGMQERTAKGDQLLNQWLEKTFYDKTREEAIKRMTDYQKDDKWFIDTGCLAHFPGEFQKAADEFANTPVNWLGTYTGPAMTLKVEMKGGFVFCTSYVAVGSSSETTQWNLTPIGNTAKGEWTCTNIYSDRTVNRTGEATIKLVDDKLTYDIFEGPWTVKWNEGIKPYQLLDTKGAHWFGTLTLVK